MKFAIIKERKNPPDRRVVLSPQACEKIVQEFPKAEILVESSDVRIFEDSKYAELGFQVLDNVSQADVMLGVKEVPIDALIPNKKYFFFSHTIKKQPYNRQLLRAILDQNIELYVMNADGSEQKNLTNNAAKDFNPSWSPDGKKIRFSTMASGTHEIYVMNADGSEQRNLANNS